MLRYRLEYLYIPKSARLRFTVLVPGPESVGHYQAERAGDEWLHLACPPLYRWDLVRLSAVFAREEAEGCSCAQPGCAECDPRAGAA